MGHQTIELHEHEEGRGKENGDTQDKINRGANIEAKRQKSFLFPMNRHSCTKKILFMSWLNIQYLYKMMPILYSLHFHPEIQPALITRKLKELKFGSVCTGQYS